ncbi:MAG: glycosyltransferase [Bacteroidales bacterium]|nr:glycosyltransferase [Bacteroidales bacterium]
MNIESLPIEVYLFIIASFLFLIQLSYYGLLYSQLIRIRKKSRKGKIPYEETLHPLSIILSADNATKELKKQLPLLLEQDYPEYEVIVINNSTDPAEVEATNDFLEYLSPKYPHLYFSFTPKSARYISRKKLSLTLGIKASKYDWLVFTEPDFCPVSNQWLRKMARNFTPSTDIVLSYAGYPEEKGLRNMKMIYNSIFDAIQHLSFAFLKHPYKGYGKNLAYRKKLFYQNKGYSSHLNLLRGEDDLFINQIATSSNTRVELSPDSMVRYEADNLYNYWKNETQNYTLSSYCYKGSQSHLLSVETCSRILFYVTTIASIIIVTKSHNYLWGGFFLGLFCLRYLFQGIIINQSAHILGYKRNFILSLPWLDFWLPFHNLKVRVQLLFKGKRNYMRKE